MLINQLSSTGIILMYHRVVELESDLWGLAVKPDYFAEHLDYIKNHCNPMPLVDLVDSIRRNQLQKRSVSITFDDGYSDNYHFAYPLLKKANLPATIFICTHYIDKGREYWWDELERILITSKVIPNNLRMKISGQDFLLSLNSHDQRKQAYGELHKSLRLLDEAKRHKAIKFLCKWSGEDDGTRSSYRPMNSTEIRQLAQDDLIHIGSHTMTHPYLKSLSYKKQYSEIKGSIERLEKLIKLPVYSMAYPYGAFNSDTLRAVNKLGIQIACTTKPGYVDSTSDCIQLPRFDVGNWDLDTFQSKIEAFFQS